MTRLALLALLAAPLAASAQTSATHEAAVRELLDVGGSRAAYELGVSAMAQTMAENNPLFERLRPVIEEFYATYASWDDVEPEFVALYVDLFSEAEVRELVAWHESDMGRRFREVQPELQRRSMEIGQRAVEEHRAELEAMIEDALRDGRPGPPPAPPKKRKGQ